jgi:tetratricopeptide (TPR) repeat protein
LRETPDLTEKQREDAAAAKRPDNTADPNQQNASGADDDLDFVVTEAHEEAPELVGGFASKEPGDLGIESTAELMQQEAQGEAEMSPLSTGFDDPIGESAPPPPPPAEKSMPDPEDHLNISGDNLETPERENGLGNLTDEQVAEISRKMKVETNEPEYLSEDEKMALLTNIDSSPTDEASKGKGFDNEPIVPPRKQKDTSAAPTVPEVKLTGETPKIAKRLRGIAYFAKGYIRITGEQELHEGDELSINGREYQLRPQKVSPKLLMAVLGPIAAVLVFALGALLSSDADTGAGSIVGMALDDNDQPILTGAAVRFPELGKFVETNSQGFFKTSQLDAGSYKIEFVVDDEVIATDYATVVDDKITTLVLRPEPTPGRASGGRAPTSPPARANQTPPPATQTQAASPPPEPKATAQKSSSGKKAAATPKYSNLVLDANVDNAKLMLGGKILGAGNLTYPKLKPGSHNYKISKDGYLPAEGTIKLAAGQTRTLSVVLEPASAAAKAEVYKEQDYYRSALSAVEQGNLIAALGDLDEAIKLSPSYSDAILKRADINRQLNDNRAAHDDYVRVAEIFNFRKEYAGAFSAYDQAIRLNDKSLPAYLGRGNLYLTRKENIAAIADFDQAVRLDKRNVDGYMGLGKARYAQGRYKKAVDRFKDARSIDSENPQIHMYLMLSYYGTGDHKQVRKSYEKFLKYANDTEIRRVKDNSQYAHVLRVAENN